jgi:hypothetical protein
MSPGEERAAFREIAERIGGDLGARLLARARASERATALAGKR